MGLRILRKNGLSGITKKQAGKMIPGLSGLSMLKSGQSVFKIRQTSGLPEPKAR